MKTLFILLGPTGVGKTDLSLDIAAYLKSPIINCDSRQIYRDLSIGTAAPTMRQIQRVQHYFVHTLDIDAYYSAAKYEAEALALINELFKTHDNLLLCGGSMMYIDAVCKGIDDIPTVDKDTRSKVLKRLSAEGLDKLFCQLQELDPTYAANVDAKNTRRVLHALEICLMTGKPYSTFLKNKPKKRPFRIVKIGLNRPREELFSRINQRVDEMVRAGLLNEVRSMLEHRDKNALNTVGYKEIFHVLDGTWSLEMAIERIKKNTRVYAKKQLTWFTKDNNIHWFHPQQRNQIFQLIAQEQ